MYFAKKKKKKRGFTLIELLVVIAIIGILATIVIVNVNSARNKAKDAAVKGSIDSIRVAAELFYDGTGNQTYTNVCSDADVAKALTAADNNNSTEVTDCNSSATEWVACGGLAGDNVNDYCVDFKGNAKSITAGTCVVAWAATVCP